MNFKKLFTGAMTALALMSCVPMASAKDIRNNPRIALMPFGNKAIVSRELNSSGMLDVASEYMTTQLVWCDRFDPLDYEQVEAALKIMQAGQSGLYDTATTAQAGKFIGAEYMIIGNITGLTLKESGAGANNSTVGGASFNKHTVTASVTLRAVDIETLRIVATGMGRDSSSSSGVEFKVPLYRKETGLSSVLDILCRRKNKEEFAINLGTGKVSDIQVINAINKAAWQAMYGKTGLITFLDGGKPMKNPPPKGL